MKSYRPLVQNCHRQYHIAYQSGYTLIELMIAIAVIGILVSTAVLSYQIQVRKAHILTIYQEINNFRLPYQILLEQGAGVTDFSPIGLNMPADTNYCHFSVTIPDINAKTEDAVVCQIHNLNYVQGETVSLALNTDGKWQCRASAGIASRYLPDECQ